MLDDPLSAVDAPTAAFLLHKCILDLFKGRTVILVTHAVGLVLPKADFIVCCKNGSIAAQGSPREISNNPALAEIVSSDLSRGRKDVSHQGDDLQVPDIALKSVPQEQNKEGKAAGSVKWATYKFYLIACGGFLFVVGVFFSFFVQVAADYLQNWWVEVWVDALKSKVDLLRDSFAINYNLFTDVFLVTFPADNQVSFASTVSLNSSSPHVVGVETFFSSTQNDSLYYITIFGLISFVELFALLIKYIIQFVGGIRASRIIHEKLSNAVLGSPMRFFEVTPVGRIINRFSKE